MASTQSHYIPGFVGRNLHPSCYMDHPVLSTNSTICWPQYPHKIPLDSNFSLLFLDGLKSFTYWTAIFSNFISPFYPHDSWWHLYFSHQISHITIIPWNPHLIARSSFMLFAHSIDNFSASTMWNLHNLHIFPYHTSFPWFSRDFPWFSHDFPMEIGHEKDPRQDRQDGSRELRQLRAALRGRQQRGAAAGGLRRGGRGLPRCRGERPWENDHGGFRNDDLMWLNLYEKDGLWLWLNVT